MPDKKYGPKPGTPGADKISEIHSGSHDHDQQGGFAADTERAKAAGRKGGEAVKQKVESGDLPPEFYHDIGLKGGLTVLAERGRDFYAKIGRRGGEVRGAQISKEAADRRAVTAD